MRDGWKDVHNQGPYNILVYNTVTLQLHLRKHIQPIDIKQTHKHEHGRKCASIKNAHTHMNICVVLVSIMEAPFIAFKLLFPIYCTRNFSLDLSDGIKLFKRPLLGISTLCRGGNPTIMSAARHLTEILLQKCKQTNRRTNKPTDGYQGLLLSNTSKDIKHISFWLN